MVANQFGFDHLSNLKIDKLYDTVSERLNEYTEAYNISE